MGKIVALTQQTCLWMHIFQCPSPHHNTCHLKPGSINYHHGNRSLTTTRLPPGFGLSQFPLPISFPEEELFSLPAGTPHLPSSKFMNKQRANINGRLSFVVYFGPGWNFGVGRRREFHDRIFTVKEKGASLRSPPPHRNQFRWGFLSEHRQFKGGESDGPFLMVIFRRKFSPSNHLRQLVKV